jgi:hypothetical protein
MVLTQLETVMKESGFSPEALAAKSQDFSNMTVRRAIKGRGIDRLKGLAIARALKVKLSDLI